MKLALSIPDELVQATQQIAQQEGISRSELIRRALSDYVNARDTDPVTEACNRVCDETDTTLPPDLKAASLQVLRRVEWED